MKRLWVLVFLLVGCGFAGDRGYDWYSSQVNTPMSATSQKVAFHIDQGESSDQIASDLAARGLIRSPEVFLVYLRYQHKGSRLEAGDFVLDKRMNMSEIIATLGNARVQQVSVTLTPGATLKAMAQSAASAGLGTAASYVAAASDLSWQYDFLQGRPQAAPGNLEGFLFPETYQLDRGSTTRDLVKRQLDQFGQQVTTALRAQMAQPAPGRPAQSVYSLITLASMVEREVFKDPDRAIVCGIFYNRLAAHMLLEDDPTVLYGLDKPQGPLTEPDKKKDTPYNTYLHPGLPAGPIANPGLASINACVSPQKTDYYFFFSDTNRVTRYAKTFAEHLKQQQQYGVAPG